MQSFFLFMLILKTRLIYRASAALFFAVIFFAQTFSSSLIIADYYRQQTAYIKNCENRDRPWMHCNGKCQMNKKLEQEQNNEKQNPERRVDNKDSSPLSSISFFPSIISRSDPSDFMDFPGFSPDKEVKMPRAFFHPPGA